MQHGIPVWQYNGQSTTATSRHRRHVTSFFQATLSPIKENMKLNYFDCSM